MEYFKGNFIILILWFLIAHLGNHLLTVNCWSQWVRSATLPLGPSFKGPGFGAGVKPPLTLNSFSNPSLLKLPTKPLGFGTPSSKVSFPSTSPKLLLQTSIIKNPTSLASGQVNLPRIKPPPLHSPAPVPAVKRPSFLSPLSTPVPAIKPPSFLPPPSFPGVKPPSILPPLSSPAVKPPSFLPPLSPPAAKPSSFLPQPYSPISPLVTKPPILPSSVQPKPIQKPHITPDSKGTYVLVPIAVASSAAVISGISILHTIPSSHSGARPSDPSKDPKKPPTCHLKPEIQNGDLNHCAGTKAGHRCRMMCQRNYEPNVKSIQCVRKSSSQAEWQLNGARCDYNVDPVCRDNFNRKVDWFVAYRVPKSFNGKTDSHLFISNLSPDRMDYQTDAEFDSSQKGNSWTDWIFDQGLLGTGKNGVGHTLSVLRQINSGGTGGSGPTLKHVLYSDQPPNGHASHSNGHSKGVLVHSNSGRGFYMVHSQPKFPQVPGTSSIYSLAKGQIFVCVTLSSHDAINRAVRHVNNLRPKKYSGDVVLGRPGLSSSTGLNEISLSSQLGTSFKLFSKSRARGDIYRLIADTYGSDIFVQTWRNGAGTKLPSDCPVGGNKVQNVELMKFSADTKDSTGWNLFGIWKRTTDHAKWMVGQDRNDNLFCAGDMNRMQSQDGRWGGAICLIDRRVARAFRQLIEEIEPCPGMGSSKLPSTSMDID